MVSPGKSPEALARILPLEFAYGSSKEACKALLAADHVVIALTGSHLGDSIIGTAFVGATLDVLKKNGKEKPITILTRESKQGIFDMLKSGNVDILTVGEREDFPYAAQMSAFPPRVFGIEVDSLLGSHPTLLRREAAGKNIPFLFPVIEKHPFDKYGTGRFAALMEDMFSLPAGFVDVAAAQPRIILPENKDEIYERLKEKFGVDETKAQVSFVVESNMVSKRFGLAKWMEVAKLILDKNPDTQINIVHNPKSGLDEFSEAAIRKQVKEAGLEEKCTLVAGMLPELAVFLQRQSVVLSNDTGLAHMVAATEEGPSVITLFNSMILQFPVNTWVWSNRQIPIVIPGEMVGIVQKGGRYIDQIPPETVAEKALDILALAK